MTATSAKTAQASPGWMFVLRVPKTCIETGAPLVGAR